VWRDYVVQTGARFVPKQSAETRSHGISLLRIILRASFVGHFSTPLSHQPQRAMPKGIDLHRLSMARRHHPIADLRIHPRKLRAGCSGREQMILRVYMYIEGRAAAVPLDNLPPSRIEGVVQKPPVAARLE